MPCGLRRTPLYTHERMRMKKANSIIMKLVFASWTRPSNVLGDCELYCTKCYPKLFLSYLGFALLTLC